MVLSVTQKIKNKINEKIFCRCSRKILNTSPFRLADSYDAVCLLSQVQDKDLRMYLLAAKSFLSHVKVSKCVVIGDRLHEESKKILKEHIVGIDLYDIADFRNPNLPMGGTWERLYAISKLCTEKYVVQLDADTLTLKELQMVNSCIRNNNGFLLGTNHGRKIKPVSEAIDFAEYHYQQGQNHIQILAERRLNIVASLGYTNYVRGCSGFCGFPKKGLTPEQLIEISKAYSHALNEKWSEWGSEQFMSNLILSNLPDTVVLPPDMYCVPTKFTEYAVFVHFIGYQRYQNRVYSRLAKNIIRTIKNS